MAEAIHPKVYHENVLPFIMANKKMVLLYAGVTSDLIKRVYQHKMVLAPCFTNDMVASILSIMKYMMT